MTKRTDTALSQFIGWTYSDRVTPGGGSMIHVTNSHGHKLDARNYQDWLKGCAFFAAIGAKFDTLACWSAGIQDFDLDAAKSTWLAAGGADDLRDLTSIDFEEFITGQIGDGTARTYTLLTNFRDTAHQMVPGLSTNTACEELAMHPIAQDSALAACVIQNFAIQINMLQEMVHGLNVHAGWWTDLETGLPKDRNDGELICLMHSELSEAMEGVRKNLMDDKLPHRKMVEVELADTVIRILDYAGGRKLDVAGALVEKLAFNTCRPDHKIDSRKAADGKKF